MGLSLHSQFGSKDVLKVEVGESFSTNVRQWEAAGVDHLTQPASEGEDRRTDERREGWMEGEVLIEEETSHRVAVMNMLLWA